VRKAWWWWLYVQIWRNVWRSVLDVSSSQNLSISKASTPPGFSFAQNRCHCKCWKNFAAAGTSSETYPVVTLPVSYNVHCVNVLPNSLKHFQPFQTLNKNSNRIWEIPRCRHGPAWLLTSSKLRKSAREPPCKSRSVDGNIKTRPILSTSCWFIHWFMLILLIFLHGYKMTIKWYKPGQW